MKRMLKICLSVITITLILVMNLSVISKAETATIITDTLRLRKEASTDSTIVALMDNGDIVEVLESNVGDDGKWYKISYIERKNGETKQIIGYAYGDYLKIGNEPVQTQASEPEPEQTPAPEPEPESTPEPVNNNEEENNVKTKEEETPASNENTEVNNETNENTEIEENEKKEETPTESETKKEEVKVNIGEEKSVSEEQDIYILPLINSPKQNKVNTEEKIKVIQVLNKWAYITTEKGVSGWIRCDKLI